MSIEKKLEEWAQDTVADYNENTEYSYYTQSPLNQIKSVPIKLLVLGINPGSDDVKIKEWGKKSPVWNEILGEEGMTAQKLMGGNPFFVSMIEKKKAGEKYKKWNFWEKLCQLLCIAGMNKLVDSFSDYAYTNIYLGSTKGEKDIPKDKYNELKEHAFELIDILQPECIICLGQKVMDAVLNHYVDNKNERDCYVEDLPIKYKMIPVKNEENHYMKVFGFHHPAYRYTEQEKELVGKFLGYYANDNRNIPECKQLPFDDDLQRLANAYRDRIKFKRSFSVSKINLNYTELINKLKELGLELYKKNDNHYWISIENNLRITIRCDKGITNVGIRRSSSQGGGWVTEEMKDNLMPQIGRIGWKQDKVSPNSWLAHLPYKESNEEKLSQDIKDTICLLSNIKYVY